MKAMLEGMIQQEETKTAAAQASQDPVRMLVRECGLKDRRVGVAEAKRLLGDAASNNISAVIPLGDGKFQVCVPEKAIREANRRRAEDEADSQVTSADILAQLVKKEVEKNKQCQQFADDSKCNDADGCAWDGNDKSCRSEKLKELVDNAAAAKKTSRENREKKRQEQRKKRKEQRKVQRKVLNEVAAAAAAAADDAFEDGSSVDSDDIMY